MCVIISNSMQLLILKCSMIDQSFPKEYLIICFTYIITVYSLVSQSHRICYSIHGIQMMWTELSLN